MRRAVLIGGLLGAVLPGGASALAAPPTTSPTPKPSQARLQGQFRMSGHVTDAANVHDVHVGDRVVRTWTFTSSCAIGPCHTVTLTRNRGRGTDHLTLKRRGAGYYTGHSSFYAPLQCGSRVYKRGELVPFTITVRITAASLSGTTVIASRIKGSYTNRSRKNLTPCVLEPSHDAARYTGRLL
jgi:hypothetical protein